MRGINDWSRILNVVFVLVGNDCYVVGFYLCFFLFLGFWMRYLLVFFGKIEEVLFVLRDQFG